MVIVSDFKNDDSKGPDYLDATSDSLRDIHASLREELGAGSKPEPLKTIIADDDCIFLAGVAALVRDWEEFELVGESSTLENARQLCAEKNPAIVMMGASFHGVGCSSTVKTIVDENPRTRIMIVASIGESGFVLDALRAGARGFASRDEMSVYRLRSVLWGVACGDICFSGSIGTALQGALLNDGADPERRAESISDDYFKTLDEREKTVLAALEEGLSNAEISQRLFLSEPTVKKCIGSIIHKLHVNNRVQAAVLSAKREK